MLTIKILFTIINSLKRILTEKITKKKKTTVHALITKKYLHVLCQ